MKDWPPEYTAGPRPHWSVRQALTAGRILADRVHADPEYAREYLAIVKAFAADKGDYSSQYLALIAVALRDAGATFDATGCNANDFANAHRAAWLYMLTAFACLVNKNPHIGSGGRPDWGDPPMVLLPTPHRGISTGEDDNVFDPRQNQRFDDFHNVPNIPGAFAISTDDIPAPDISG